MAQPEFLFYTDTGNIPHKYLIFPVLSSSCCISFTNDIRSCHFVLLPVMWEVLYALSDAEYVSHDFDPQDRGMLISHSMELIEKARSAGKKIVLFYYRDDEKAIPVENAIVFRTSVAASGEKENELAMPAWVADVQAGPWHKSGYRTKSMSPSVGFRGGAMPFEPVLKDKLKLAVNKISELTGLPLELPLAWDSAYRLRTKVMKILRNCPSISTDFFILSQSFLTDDFPGPKVEGAKAFTLSLIENDYTLCVRGNGNYSLRFYETMSAGRIPLFINTGCTLPFHDLLPWKELCVWVDENNIGRCGDVLLDFHRNITEDGFLALQNKNRAIWEQWLTREGFFRNFTKMLADRL